MIYMRGNAKDYDNWAASGNTGWSFAECLPFFKKLENMKSPDLASGTNNTIMSIQCHDNNS
jgi:choline dehydrogenase